MEQYLHMYSNYQHNNWSSLLSLAEFAYNNAPNATTRVSPFFTNKGYDPANTIHLEYNLVSARAYKYVTDLIELHSELWNAITLSQEQYQCSADKNRNLLPDFTGGDQAFVKAKFFQTTRPSKKLSEKYLGLFNIIAQAGPLSWTLCLPDSMRAVHPIFHVSMLEPSIPNTIPDQVQPPPLPVMVDGEPEYKISEILDSKFDNRWHLCKLLYLVRWSGYEGTDKEISWLLATKLGNAPELINHFHHQYPHKPGPLSIP